MADKDFRIDLILGAKFAEAFRALDSAKKKIGDVDKAADKFGRGAGTAVGTTLRASATAAVAAATTATAVMGLYIAKTIEAEKVQAQLQARLKDTGGVAGRTLEQLNKQAGDLQKITIFDDESVGNAQAMLLTFTQIRGTNFDGAVESALDLATVMGTDATSAAKILGKALSDPEKGLAALTKAGVTFTESERARIQKMLEAGQIAEAQAAILEKLRGSMGSAAEAARDTLGGALQALKNSFDNLLEGDTGDEGIVGTRAAIESLIDLLNDPATKQGFDNIVSGLARAAAAAINAAAEVANFTRWVGEEVASRVGGPASDDVVRIEQAIERQQSLIDQLDQKGTGAERRNTSAYAEAQRAELRRLQGLLTQADGANKQADDFAKYRGLPKDWGLNFNPNPTNPAPEGQGVSSPGKAKKTGGSKSDPDADIKNRIADLKEEAALLGAVKDGEEKASEAARVRYAITEGEFKNKSPQLKAELLAAAEAVDAANKKKKAEEEVAEAAKKSAEAYADLRRELRTPAEVAVDEAIAKLHTLTEAMDRKDASPEEVDAAKKKVLGQTFEKAPDFGFGMHDPSSVLAEQSAQLDAWYQGELTKLAAFRESKLGTIEEYNKLEQDIEAQHQAGLQQLQFQQSQIMLGAASSLFGSLAEIARTGAGEQSKAYRAMFALSQGFAVAQALIAVYQNAAEASKKAGGWPANIPIIAGAIAQGLAIVAQIRGVQTSGFAEGGYTGAGGKHEIAGFVHRDEGVLSKERIAKLGGASGFYRLESLIDEGRIWDRMRGIAGYAAGGLVGASGPVLVPPDYASYPQGAAGLTANLQNNMRLYNLFDIDALAQKLATHPVMEKQFVVIASENGSGIQASWGNST